VIASSIVHSSLQEDGDDKADQEARRSLQNVTMKRQNAEEEKDQKRQRGRESVRRGAIKAKSRV